jgi:glycosyltransferase involved in cell wall biosynthesis
MDDTHSLTASIVLPTWRRPADLLRCLSGIARQSVAPLEIVVVVRADDDETRQALASMTIAFTRPPRIVFVDQPGLVAALNHGYQASVGDVICCLDDDAIPHEDWLERLLAHYQNSNVVAVGGRDWIHEGSHRVEEQAAVVGIITWYGRCVGNHHLGAGSSRDVHFLKGVNLSYRRSAVGGLPFDPLLRGSGSQPHSEIGLCLRLARNGPIVYDPRVAVEHYLGPRWDDERAGARSSADIMVSAHNRFYSLMADLTGLRRIVVLAFQGLAGSRDDPGPLLALERVIFGEFAAIGRCKAACIGRLVALKTLRSRRARDRRSLSPSVRDLTHD